MPALDTTATRTDEQAKVRIAVQSEYLPNIKISDENEYCFAYQIAIRNLGDSPFTLLSRHWIITDGDNKVREVSGDGVIGEQPRILPGREFSYVSFVDMPTTVGFMSGKYDMVRDDGGKFQVDIPLFSLALPVTLH